MITGHQFIPTIFTIFNLFFGFFSIWKSLEGNLHSAAWFIIVAIICDGLDGLLARIYATESNFGIEFDSFADLVSSGIAPAILIYAGRLNIIPLAGVLIGFFYLFCAVYRLARFNITRKGKKAEVYQGLPLPVAAITISSLWIFRYPSATWIPLALWIALMIFLSVVMITTIPYQWPRLDYQSTWKRSVAIGGFTVVLVSFILFPHIILFPFFILYITVGIVHWMIQIIQKKTLFSQLWGSDKNGSLRKRGTH